MLSELLLSPAALAGACFAAAIASPGWGALAAGVLAYACPGGSFALLSGAAAAGGFAGDALAFLLWRRRPAETLPASPEDARRRALLSRLRQIFPAAGVGLQSVQLFRRDWAGLEARRRAPAGAFLLSLAAGSVIGALAGAALAQFALARHFGAWGPGEARAILPGLMLLALLVAETGRIVLERLAQRSQRFLSQSHHENSPR